jgi:hypothetical protein
MKFTKLDVLSSFRTTSTGDFFYIIPGNGDQPGTFFSLNSYMFKEIATGNIASIEYEEAGMMPVTKDKNGVDRPPTKATKVKEITSSDRGKLVDSIDMGKLKVEDTKVKLELKALEVDL